jgi:CDP-diacylglycerol pyrophosphatase
MFMRPAASNSRRTTLSRVSVASHTPAAFPSGAIRALGLPSSSAGVFLQNHPILALIGPKVPTTASPQRGHNPLDYIAVASAVPARFTRRVLSLSLGNLRMQRGVMPFLDSAGCEKRRPHWVRIAIWRPAVSARRQMKERMVLPMNVEDRTKDPQIPAAYPELHPRKRQISPLPGLSALFLGSLAAVVIYVGAAIATSGTLLSTKAAQKDPDALWTIVNDQCVQDEIQNRDPYPCLQVDLSQGLGKGYALLKDRSGLTQLLLIPTAKITGIESPEIQRPGATNYFAGAWHARAFLEALAHKSLPRTAISLAINSKYSRSQSQLHIHIDCLRQDISETLRAASIGDTWTPLDFPGLGHHYLARRVPGDELNVNPFELLADEVPGAKENMDQQTLVVIGAAFKEGLPGFIILQSRLDRETGNLAQGEELQDHACSIAGL